MLIVAAVATILTVPFVFTHEGRNHIIRAYLMGYMTCFGFAGGGLVLLMLQYVTGGKWGLLLRRPLEAMTRTMLARCTDVRPHRLLHEAPVPVGESIRQRPQQPRRWPNHWISLEQALTANAKRAMLSPVSAIVQTAIVFGILLTFTYF